jgi:enamine deaminase RidA (YjgF/YER057c/UK114 family)
MERQLISSGSPYEHHIGLSRAVRVGPVIAVAGTAPLDHEGKTMHAGDVYAQTKRCLEIMINAIERAGGAREHVVRTRIMVVDIALWKDAARAHGEVFSSVKPACTFVQVSAFIEPDWLVETEADCYVP